MTRSSRLLFAVLCWVACEAFAADDNRHVVLQEKIGPYFSISPDGNLLAYNNIPLREGLHILNIRSGQKTLIKPLPDKMLDMPRWSSDGTKIVAVSIGYKNDFYDIKGKYRYGIFRTRVGAQEITPVVDVTQDVLHYGLATSADTLYIRQSGSDTIERFPIPPQ